VAAFLFVLELDLIPCDVIISSYPYSQDGTGERRQEMKLSLKNANLKIKLFSFAGLAIFLVLVIVATGLFFYSHIEKNNSAIDQANLKIEGANQSIEEANKFIEGAGEAKTQINEAVKDVMTLRLTEKTYLQFFTPELKNQFDTQAKKIANQLEVLKKEGLSSSFQEYSNFFGQYVDVHTQHHELKKKMPEPLKESQRLLRAIISELEEKEQEKQMQGEALAADEAEMMNVSRDYQIVFLKLQNIQQQFLATGDKKFIEEYKKLASGDVKAHLAALQEFSFALHNENFIKNSKIIQDSLDTFLGYIEKSLSFITKENELIGLLNKSGINIIKSAGVLLTQADQSVVDAKNKASEERDKATAAGKSSVLAKNAAKAAKSSATIFISIIVVSGIMLFIILSFLLLRSIMKPLNRAIEGLTNGAEQVASGSGQVAYSSQQLAEGASEQAASIEETSASLEEMSSMTKQNADNANQADNLMKEANQIVSKANGSMSDLTVSMEEISKASEDTSKIIKTIDEIAFQTNLLALNAAVEAARAGEAGAGFAVVADEVRNLAMRAADAAKNTAALIEETLKKVKDGGNLVARTSDAFTQVAESSTKVGGLVGEISAASNEQAQGISQVNSAVTEMDKIVQQNAANAEESASASEEMNDQAEKMRGYVQDLITLVGSNAKSEIRPAHTRVKAPKSITGESHARVRKEVVAANSRKITPEQIIPLDNDFVDF
jgi:X-X-X-Leu-X-X-Gly heptad repeat protein